MVERLPDDIRGAQITRDQVVILDGLRRQIVDTAEQSDRLRYATELMVYNRGAPRGSTVDPATTTFLDDHERGLLQQCDEDAVDAVAAAQILGEWQERSGWNRWVEDLVAEFFPRDDPPKP